MRLSAVVAGLLFALPALAQPGLAPSLKQVANVDKDKGHFMITEVVQVPVTVTVERIVIVNGQQVKELVPETRIVQEQRIVVYQAAKNRFIGRDGKAVPIADVWKRLKKDDVIAISGGVNPPSEEFLRALSPDILIVIPAGPVGPPPPKKD